MLRISSAEKQFIEGGVACGIRGDGRTRLAYRHLTLETGIISQANGSARVRISNTDILVGVKVELSEPGPDFPNQGRIKFAVECCPSASPEFEGKGAEELNHEIARLMEHLVRSSTALDLASLCLIPNELCWIIYVDVMVLDSGGNLFDATSIASRAALANTRVPKVEVMAGGGKNDIEVSDDLLLAAKIDVSKVPVCVSLCKIGSHFVVDPTLEEELCMKVRLSVGVNGQGHTCALQKGGSGGLEPSLIFEMIKTAQEIGMELVQRIDVALKEEEKLGREAIGFFAAPF